MCEHLVIIMNQDPELSFEEFQGKINNMLLYFVKCEEKGIDWNHYRRKDAFLRFKDEHPQLEEMLTENLSTLLGKIRYTRDSRNEALDEIGQKFYEAYKVMRKYVETDKDLFA
jgi:hypothetical protein